MGRRALILLLTVVVATGAAAAADVPSADSARCLLRRLPLCDVEGLWQLTGEGDVVVMVVRDDADGDTAASPSKFNIVAVEADNRALLPGTVLGSMTPTARPLTYDARVCTDLDSRGRPVKAARFTVKVESGSHMSFMRVNTGVRVSPIVLFPYFLRRGMKIGSDRPRDLDGAIKIYPRVPVEGSPRYL